MFHYTFNILQSEAFLARLDFVKEHGLGAGPEFAIVVKGTVED